MMHSKVLFKIILLTYAKKKIMDLPTLQSNFYLVYKVKKEVQQEIIVQSLVIY